MDTRLPAYYAALCYLMKGVFTMAYAYGMRFDDDSNAITVIDEDNQTAVTTGYINGEYVEFDGGGNPNHVQTITGTATNPFGDVNVSELKTAIMNSDANAEIFMDMTQLNGSTYNMPFDIPASESNFLETTAASVDIVGNNTKAIEVAWNDNGDIYVLKSFLNGQATDAKQYAGMIPTTLTIIWHPLPTE